MSQQDDINSLQATGTKVAELQRRRNKILVGAIVFALLMNVGWQIAGVFRDRQRTTTIKDLSRAVRNLATQNDDLRSRIQTINLTVDGLAKALENTSETAAILEQIKNLSLDQKRSLDCVALWTVGRPSRSPDCIDVNKRLNDLDRGRRVFGTIPTPGTTTTTRPRVTPPSNPGVPPPPPPVVSTTVPQRATQDPGLLCQLLGILCP